MSRRIAAVAEERPVPDVSPAKIGRLQMVRPRKETHVPLHDGAEPLGGLAVADRSALRAQEVQSGDPGRRRAQALAADHRAEVVVGACASRHLSTR